MAGDGAKDRADLSGGNGLIDLALLELLACPLCESRPPLIERGSYLVCTEAGHGFPVVNGIPHLLPENAIEREKMMELPDAG